MEITVNPAVVAGARKPISMIGGFLANQYFKPLSRDCWPEFEKDKLNAQQNSNVPLITNRAPRRYRMKGYDIVKVEIGQDATGGNNVYLNRDMAGEVAVPIAPGMEKIGVVTEDAIGSALNGDENVIFANPMKLAKNLNAYNLAEKKRCQDLIEKLGKIVQQIDTAIAENLKKAEAYEKEILDSTPKNDPAFKSSGPVVVVSQDE